MQAAAAVDSRVYIRGSGGGPLARNWDTSIELKKFSRSRTYREREINNTGREREEGGEELISQCYL